jgi:hypothetical protein
MRRGGILQLLLGVAVLGALVVVASTEGTRILKGVKASAEPSAERFSGRTAPFLSMGTSAGGAIAPRVAVLADGSAAVAWLGRAKPDVWSDRVEVRALKRDGVAGATGATHGKEPFVVSPVVAVAGDGGLWLAFMGTPQSPLDDLSDLATLYVARAAPGTVAFSTPSNVAQGDAVASWGGTWAAPYGDLIALVHRAVEGGHGRIFFSAVGQGDPGAQIVAEGDELATARCSICATPARAYVLWWESPGVVKVRASDAGGHFRTTRAVIVSLPGELAAAVPPSCVAIGDRLEVMYGLSASSPLVAPTVLSRVVLARSVDAGRTFPVRAMLGEPRTRIVASDLTLSPSGEPLVGALVTTPGSDDVTLRWARPNAAAPGELVVRDAPGRPLPEDPSHVAATHGLLHVATGAGRTVAAFAEGPVVPQVSFVELEP